MKNTLIVLMICVLSITAFGQNMNFDAIVLDTSEHFNLSPFTNDGSEANLVIDNDSMHRATFRWSTFTVRHPRFKKAIWLKRTIRGNCLTNIKNRVTIDSTNRTVTWTSIVESANCNSKDTRHIVIQIPKPPEGFEVLFDKQYVKSDSEKYTPIQKNIERNALSCELLYEFYNFRGPTGVIDNDSLFTIWNKNGMNCEKPDFSKKLLLVGSYGGDCHMELETHLSFDPITNTLILNTYNIWGGCRAGGSRSFAILVEKPKENFDVVFQEIQLENWPEYIEQTGRTMDLNSKE